MSTIPPLYVLAGLVNGSTPAGPVPPLEIATAQLRALNHRFVDAAADPEAQLMEAMVHPDFVATRRDGAWLDRAAFIADVHDRASPAPLRDADTMVRQFGPLALVHGALVCDAGSGTPTALRYTDVHLWSGSAWRLLSAQDTVLATGVPVALRRGVVPPHPAWPGQDPAGDDEAVLRALNEHYVRAFREADVAWYAAHLSSDYIVINGDGSSGDRAAALQRFAQPTFATTMKSFPVDRVRIRRFGDLGLIHAENDYELKDGRRGVSRYTDIWHRQAEGRWRCVAAHITALRAPA